MAGGLASLRVLIYLSVTPHHIFRGTNADTGKAICPDAVAL